MMRNTNSLHDPEGYMTYKDGELVRVLSDNYLPTYKHFMESGLYKELLGKGYIIKHEELSPDTLKPDFIPFITYANEWSFSELKHAALLTLRIQKIALEYGMSLKDASTSNIQFDGSLLKFIDTSSFEMYKDGMAWQGYNQFCEEFLVPLSLGAYVSLELMKYHIPLNIASRIIPKYHFLSSLGLHIYLQSKTSNRKTLPKNRYISKSGLVAIIDNLISTVKNLKLPKEKTLWDNYYDKTSNYTLSDYGAKKRFVEEAMRIVLPKRVIDLGCNKGLFTTVAKDNTEFVVALDNDYQSIDYLYKKDYPNVMPLVADLCNPTPDSGWLNGEKTSLLKRLEALNCDLVLALALVHHLCFRNSIPLEQIAYLFSELGKWLVVEFVPESDPQVVGMTQTIKTHHPYNKEVFVDTFKEYYEIRKSWELPNSKRTLYLMRGL